MIPGLYLRLADEDEVIGTDWAEMGERAYGYLPFEGGKNDITVTVDSQNSEKDVNTLNNVELAQKKGPRSEETDEMVITSALPSSSNESIQEKH